MKKLLNPRGYLSWTQVDMWQHSPQRYIRKYILNQDTEFRNSGIEHGKRTSEALETGDYGEDDVMTAVGSLLPRYTHAEHEIRVPMDTIYGQVVLLGKLDTFHDVTLAFREYKTGRVKWDINRAKKHKQLPHYATLIFLKHGQVPPGAHLDWIETREVDGQVEFTGKIESYPVKIGLGEIMEYMALVTRVAKEIDVEYRKHLKNLT